MTIKASNFPTTRPTLNLDFAKTKQLDPRVTFSRASSGTYVDVNGVIQSAASGVARFDHNPTTGESLGLLVEEGRTNLLTYSEYLNPTYGGVFGTSRLNAGLAPNNTFTATEFTLGSSGAWITPGAGTWTYSVYVKQGTSTNFNLIYAGYGGTDWAFVFSTEAFTVSGAWSNPVVQKLPNGWYRLSATSSARNLYYFFFTTSSSTTTVLSWGFQIEAGSFPTSYIPTPATFTSRASTATYYDANGVIQTAASNVARSNAFFPDSNGVMRPAGLLLEAAGTNLFTYSEDFSNAAWTKLNITVTSNAANAPDGTSTADLIVPSTANASHTVYTSATVGNTTHSRFVYAKAAGYRYLQLDMSAVYDTSCFANFDLQDGLVGSKGATVLSSGIEKLPNGWYKCYLTAGLPPGGAGSAFMHIAVVDSLTAGRLPGFAGDGTSGIYIWGAQVEASSFPTSYIPTTTATVTRAADVSSSATVTRSADVASITGTNFSSWYNQSAGSLLAVTNRSNNSSEPFSAWSLSDNPLCAIYQTRSLFRINNYGLIPGSGVTGLMRQIYAYTDGISVAGVSNGNTVLTASASTPVTCTSLRIGGYSSYYLNGTIARLTYWPTRLSNATLQTITR